MNRLDCQLTISFHTFLGMTFHIVGPRRDTHIFRSWQFFSCSCGNSGFTHGSVIVHNIFDYFTRSLSTSQVYMIQERCWFSQINFFIEYFPHRINVLFLSSQLMSSTYTDKNNPFSRCTNEHSQLETFSQPKFNRTFSNCLSLNSLDRG